MDAINVPVLFIAALEQDVNRKPSTGMLEYVKSVSSVDIGSSFFVGDAAGRISDHSDCDLKIAVNMGMRFYTPEEFFLGRKEVLQIVFYDLGCNLKRQEFEKTLRMVVRGNKNYKEQEEDKIICKNINFSMSNSHEILDKIKSQEFDVLFVYGKGNLTGKSYFAKCYFNEYKIIRDSKMFVPGEKNIYVNCMDKYFLLKYKKSP
ncbi:DNA kinase/phosphatase Pnk1, partial [Conglomerata obtusa]